MKPTTLIISAGGDAVLPHILVPLQTASTISLEDGRKLFLPSSIHSAEIVEPTLFGEWVITTNVEVQAALDETRTLPFEYIELRPEDSPGFLVYLHATLPANASLLLTYDGTGHTPIHWVLPKKSVTSAGVQKITGLFEVPENIMLKYAIFPRESDVPFSVIDLQHDVIPTLEKEESHDSLHSFRVP